MKIKRVVFSILFAGLFLPYLNSCKKETPKTVPTAIISTALNITATSASLQGEITADGGATIMERGVCYSTHQNPITSDSKIIYGTGIGSYTVSLTGLTTGSIYYVKSYAINSAGTGYSSQSTFKTLALASVLTTAQLMNITKSSATSGGNVSNDGGSQVITRGVCFNISQNPTIANAKTVDGAGTGSYISSITGLSPNTTYYVRAYATNSVGTAYGSQVNFNSSDYPNCGTVTDVDGNIYKTVTIGTQCWIRENLKTTKYNDGTSIPNITGEWAWIALTTGAYSWFDNLKDAYGIYGILYNWYSINTGKLAPKGWHVPSDSEWTILTDYLTLNGYGYGGSGTDIAKSLASTSLWEGNNTEGNTGNDRSSNNSSGFSAFPGASRDMFGNCLAIDLGGYWWSSTSTAVSAQAAWYRCIYTNKNDVGRYSGSTRCGFSVRCVKD